MQKEICIKAYRDEFAYELLDTGNKLKLERIEKLLIVRSEPRAWWRPCLPQSEWSRAVAVFDREDTKKWVFKQQLPKDFFLEFLGLKIKLLFPRSSKHVGVFPEQYEQWRWIEECMGQKKTTKHRVLNLFGYTGVASLVAARAGGDVVHVDGSKTTIAWARENQELSGLKHAPIRWILDDATEFLKREVKRGNRYDGIIMDPPSFGRGPKGQVWKIEEDFPELLSLCGTLLSDAPLFLMLNMYSTELSSISLANVLVDAIKERKGNLEYGELGIEEKGGGRILPLSIFARWKAE